MSSICAIGLMSGTSYDGVDVALLNTDGETIDGVGPTGYRPYSEQERAVVRRAIAAGGNLSLANRAERPKILADAEDLVTDMHAEAVEAFLAANGMPASQVSVVGFHGQTILHRPDRGMTVQLGDGRALAARLGIPVVYDFRAADIAAGGQGAPVVPVFHRAMVRMLKEQHPVGVLNIGGVANVTWIGRDRTLIAFDTGPGNALIDDWMLRHTGMAVDAEGQTAAGGNVDEAILNELLMNPYFGCVPPKSLDRNAFAVDPVLPLSVADGAATLTAFSAASIARAREHFPEEPTLWAICGGGRRNRTLMTMVAARVESALAPAEAAGFDGDAVEAEAWAYLAVRSLKGLPITFPGTTGVAAPMTGGVLARGGLRR
jgi:anhydro-N-acetylmuramic acid kinase